MGTSDSQSSVNKEGPLKCIEFVRGVIVFRDRISCIVSSGVADVATSKRSEDSSEVRDIKKTKVIVIGNIADIATIDSTIAAINRNILPRKEDPQPHYELRLVAGEIIIIVVAGQLILQKSVDFYCSWNTGL